MSSFRKAIPQKAHKERSQPLARQRLGLLEKHKDYVLRAKDYHSKERRIKSMKEKASMRNPDEFYFKMIHSQLKEGDHISKRTQHYGTDFIKMIKTQDLSYINYKTTLEKKKIEKLKANLHFLANEKEEKESDDVNDLVEKDSKGLKRRHIVFVDNDEEVKKLDPLTYLDTTHEYLFQTSNRPRRDQLENPTKELQKKELSTKERKLSEREKSKKYEEMKARLDREQKLEKVRQEMSIQKHLMGKGKRRKVGRDENNLPVYRWTQERKK